MLRTRFWAGRRDRLALALAGVLVLATGLSAMSTLTDSVQGTVTKAYEQTWRTPYDILVHVPLPDGAKLPDLAEPNLLTTLPPGITLAQWEQVRQTAGVAVAAPLAVVGYMAAGPTVTVPSPEIPTPPDGLYQFRYTSAAADPAVPQRIENFQRFAFALKSPPDPAWPRGTWVVDRHPATGVGSSAFMPVLLAGIDPVAESQLTGLDQTVTQGRYLTDKERVDWQTLYLNKDETDYIKWPTIPVLINLHAFRSMDYTFALEALNADLSVKQVLLQQHWGSDEMADAIVKGQIYGQALAGGSATMHPMLGRSGPIRYQPVASPFPDRWPAAVAIAPQAADLSQAFSVHLTFAVHADVGPTYRTWQPAERTTTPEKLSHMGEVGYKVIGQFDSARLQTVKDPVTNMPLLTYSPAAASQVLDAAGKPVNPPRTLSGGISPVGFLSAPPALITTIAGAVAVAGDGVINAIQVKVAGAEHFTPESVDRVSQVARAIEQATGLTAEVTMGSSPMNLLIQTPPSGGQAGFGWVEERWIHKNAGVTTVQQVEFGYSSFLLILLAVGILYTLATALAGVTARRRELGLAVAIGWPGGSIGRLVAGEQALFGLAAGLLAALAAALQGASLRAVGLVLAAAAAVYLPAMLLAGYAATRTAPGEALRWGDTAPGRRVLPGTGILPLALSSLMGRPVRIALTVLAVALPTGLLLVLTFVTRRLNGVLYTTLTGQYAALKAGPIQYLMGLIALAIAAVTAYDLIHQNAADHRQERAVLFALGWPRWRIGLTLMTEGALLGAASGLAGTAAGVAVLAILYGEMAPGVWTVALAVWALPLALGLLTGLLTALTELRAWDRSALAGVQARQVARFGRASGLAAAGLAVLLAGGLVWAVWPRLTAGMRSLAATTAVPESAAARVARAITAAVDSQNAALASLDVEKFLATIDPASAPYAAQQRHFIEELAATTAGLATPQAPAITRQVNHVALLGENTANVQLIQSIPGADPITLNTVWVLLGDRWYEHGYQRSVLSTPDAVVWYPVDVPKSAAAETAANATAALARADSLGWPLRRPVFIDLAGAEEQQRLERLPGVAAAASKGHLDPVWVEYGGPALVQQGRTPTANWLLVAFIQQSLLAQSHNQAADWLRAGATMLAYYQQSGVTVEQLLQTTPATQADLLRLHLDYGTDDAENVALVSRAGLFVAYLQEQYGKETLPAILAQLGQLPEDPRGSTPVSWADRDKNTLAAVAQVTGKSWTTLQTEFEAWIQGR